MSAQVPGLDYEALSEIMKRASRARTEAHARGWPDTLGAARLVIGWRVNARLKAFVRKQQQDPISSFPSDVRSALLFGLPVVFDPTLHGDAMTLRWEVPL